MYMPIDSHTTLAQDKAQVVLVVKSIVIRCHVLHQFDGPRDRFTAGTSMTVFLFSFIFSHHHNHPR
jgi:hypothetical protein